AHAKSSPQFQTLRRVRGANWHVCGPALMVSRRDFLAGASAFLLPQSSRKRPDLKSSFALSPIRFREVAQRAGLDFVLQNNPTPRKHMIETMPGGVAAFDYDNDGWLDLFVVNYAHWTPDFDRYCGERDRNLRVYCHPKYFEGLPNTLYRNRRDGTFEDVTAKAGIAGHIGRGMSVAFADYDNDGFTDVFVTNDNLPNFLFHNRGDGTFEEVALQAGVALTNNGLPVASMGADFRDFDNDGLCDLNVTALAGETFPLFQNLAKGSFQDATHKSRLAALST